jgi:hypothetical protein
MRNLTDFEVFKFCTVHYYRCHICHFCTASNMRYFELKTCTLVEVEHNIQYPDLISNFVETLRCHIWILKIELHIAQTTFRVSIVDLAFCGDFTCAEVLIRVLLFWFELGDSMESNNSCGTHASCSKLTEGFFFVSQTYISLTKPKNINKTQLIHYIGYVFLLYLSVCCKHTTSMTKFNPY